MREVVKAVVRNTLATARADVRRAPIAEWTVQDGEVREPVTGEARSGEPAMHSGADDERSETDGASGAMSPKAASRGVVCSAVKVGGIVNMKGVTGEMDAE